jgi:hypothetical protein
MRSINLVVSMLVLAAVLGGAIVTPRAQAAAPADSPGHDSPFGIAANLGNRVRSDEQPAMVSLMREAGVRWAREEISWERVQLERGGPYRWAGDATGLYNYDRAIELQRAADINVLGLLAYNPAWFKSRNPVIDEWLSDWGDYVYNTVARYGRERKQIRYWEVWNEPNLRAFGYEHGLYTIQDFARLLHVSHAAIKAADPEAVIVLGGLADIWGPIPTPEDYDSLDYLRMIHAAGAWNTFDIVGWHPYRPDAPEAVLHRRGPDMSFTDELDTLQQMLAEFGPKPIWLTEIGWSAFIGIFGVSEAAQAAYLQRMYVQAIAHPAVDKVFWYDLRNDTSSDAPYERPFLNNHEEQFHYGLVRREYPLNLESGTLRKPAFAAYRALTDAIGDMRFERIVADGARPDMPGVYWYRFTTGSRNADIIWRLYGDPIDVQVPCDCREARVRRWDGTLEKVTLTESNQIAGRLEEIGSPVVIETGPDKIQRGMLFPETGHYLGGDFLVRWREGGGLSQFGYPITGELIEPEPGTNKARRVQYFERNRFDYFPEFRNTPFVVQLGRLGDVALQRSGINWPTLPRRQEADEGCTFFERTGKQICAPFLEQWELSGGLSRHGMPLTDAFDRDGRQVQYFERSRFEWHPDNPPAFQVQLGLLSRELYASWGRWR